MSGALAEFTQPLVLGGPIPGPRRVCALELEDDEALIVPAALQRGNVPAAEEVLPSEIGHHPRSLSEIALERAAIVDGQPRHDVCRHLTGLEPATSSVTGR